MGKAPIALKVLATHPPNLFEISGIDPPPTLKSPAWGEGDRGVRSSPRPAAMCMYVLLALLMHPTMQ